jgi:hypothetical protein
MESVRTGLADAALSHSRRRAEGHDPTVPASSLSAFMS